MWRTMLFTTAAFVTLVAAAATPSSITIKATKKTVDTDRDIEHRSVKKTVSHASKEQFYNIEIGTMSRGLPDYVNVRWIVLLEDSRGHSWVGTQGQKDTPLSINKASEVQTDTFTLESDTMMRRGSTRERESSIRGVGVRVCDDNGRILAEKYDPPGAEKDLLEAFDRAKHRER